MASTSYTKEDRKGTEHFDKAKDMGNDMGIKSKDTATGVMGAVKEVGSEVMDKAKNIGATVVDKAKDAATSVGDMATSAAGAVGQKADDMTAAAGHGIKGFGDTIARNTPHEGWTGAATQAVAEGFRGTGRYMEDAKLSGMAHDVENVIKNHPIPALLITFGIGFCLGRALSD